ncbi:hypothetical protein [Pseudomonas phage vB_Pa-PAC2]
MCSVLNALKTPHYAGFLVIVLQRKHINIIR